MYMKNLIDWDSIQIKPGSKGNIKTVCPVCSHTRKKKTDPCLSVNVEKGVARCWNCDSVGTKKQERFTLPPQTWQNFTTLSDKLVKWFKDKRGISQQTLIDCKITEEKKYQPALQKEVNNIVFNYFYGDIVLNKKYRSANKQFTQEKNAKKVFYGINDIEDAKEVFIVEGEMDKLAFWEMGIKNCISVPNGAKDLNDIFDTCKKELENVDKFYIAVDQDEPGKELEENLVRRLGAWRCEKVTFDYKDANDQLINDRINFKTCIDNPTKYPISGTFTALDIKDDLLKFYDHGHSETLKPKGDEWEEWNELFSILMGQLTTVTGIPSHGKSNWLEWYVMSLLNTYDHLKVSFFSPEHLPMSSHQSVLAEKFVGKSFDKESKNRMTKTELNKYLQWSKDRVYLTAPDDDSIPNWKWLFDKFREQIRAYGVNIFVVDAFNKVKRKQVDSLGEIAQILSMITSFAQAHNVHIFLIAHPTKMQKGDDGVYKVPDLYSVKGSGDFRDQTHNGITVYRRFHEDGTSSTEVYNQKAKFKHQGSGNIGNHVTMSYNLDNGRYYKFGGLKNNALLIDEAVMEEEELFDTDQFHSNDTLKNNRSLTYNFDEECPF